MEEIAKKKILVTGANGFLGFNFIKKLKEENKYQIYEYCYFSTDKDLKRYCKDCDFVFHFAGVVKAKEDKTFVASYFRHIPESFLPTYSSIILACQLTGVQMGAFVLGMVPMVACLMLLGYLFYYIVQ